MPTEGQGKAKNSGRASDSARVISHTCTDVVFGLGYVTI